MKDDEQLESAFQAAYEQTGAAPRCALFDARVTAPMDQLPMAVADETGEALPPSRLGQLVEAGWLPALPHEGADGNSLGFAMYAPARIGLYLALEREGYAPEEITAVATYEDALIRDNVASGDLAYLDDPVNECVRHLGKELAEIDDAADLVECDAREDRNYQWAMGLGRIAAARAGVPQSAALGASALGRVLRTHAGALCAEIDRLRTTNWGGAPSSAKQHLERNAFRIRVHADTLRLWLVENDRAQIRAGYSPTLVFRMRGRTPEAGHVFEHILWEDSLRSPWLVEDLDSASVRVPGFRLVGSSIMTTRTHTPPEYKAAWQRHGFEAYLAARAKLRGERACPHCGGTLAGAIDPRRRYCGETCRQSARQRRYRERNPEQVKRSRQKWYYA